MLVMQCYNLLIMNIFLGYYEFAPQSTVSM